MNTPELVKSLTGAVLYGTAAIWALYRVYRELRPKDKAGKR